MSDLSIKNGDIDQEEWGYYMTIITVQVEYFIGIPPVIIGKSPLPGLGLHLIFDVSLFSIHRGDVNHRQWIILGD